MVNLSDIKHLPLLSSPAINFITAKINPEPLALISNKISKIEALGWVLKGTGGDGLTVTQTKNLTSIRFGEHPLHSYLSTHLSLCSDRGRKSHIDHHAPGACRIEPKSELGRCRYHPWLANGGKQFKYTTTCYGDTVNFQIVRGSPDSISQDKVYCSTGLLILLLPLQNLYFAIPSSRFRTLKWSNTSRRTFTRPKVRGSKTQYPTLL